jgi:hypothetical protein
MARKIEPPRLDAGRPADDFVGPCMPPMIAWFRAGEPGWPYHRPEWISDERWAEIEGKPESRYEQLTLAL